MTDAPPILSIHIRLSEGPACQVRCLEGRARRVRSATLDHPLELHRHNKTCLSNSARHR